MESSLIELLCTFSREERKIGPILDLPLLIDHQDFITRVSPKLRKKPVSNDFTTQDPLSKQLLRSLLVLSSPLSKD